MAHTKCTVQLFYAPKDFSIISYLDPSRQIIGHCVGIISTLMIKFYDSLDYRQNNLILSVLHDIVFDINI